LSHEMESSQGRRLLDLPNATRAVPVCEVPSALPGSESPSRAQGSRRNLGDLMRGRVALCRAGPPRKGEEPSPWMNVHEKSDGCVVPSKPRTKPGDSPVAESVEGRRPVGRKASGDIRPGHRTGYGVHRKPRAYEQMVLMVPPVASDSRQEPGAGKPHAGICAGGPGQPGPLPRPKRRAVQQSARTAGHRCRGEVRL